MTNKKTYHIERLEDTSLSGISGGLSENLDIALVGFGAIGALSGMVGGSACAIASAVYSSKSHKAIQDGDTKKAEKYAKTAKGLTIATAALIGAVPVGTISGTVGYVDVMKKYHK